MSNMHVMYDACLRELEKISMGTALIKTPSGRQIFGGSPPISSPSHTAAAIKTPSGRQIFAGEPSQGVKLPTGSGKTGPGMTLFGGG